MNYFLLILSRKFKSIFFYDQLKSTYLSQSAWCLVRIPQWFSLYTWLYKNLLTVTDEGSGTETSCWDQLSLSASHSLHHSAYIQKHCWTWGLILNPLLHPFCLFFIKPVNIMLKKYFHSKMSHKVDSSGRIFCQCRRFHRPHCCVCNYIIDLYIYDILKTQNVEKYGSVHHPLFNKLDFNIWWQH